MKRTVFGVVVVAVVLVTSVMQLPKQNNDRRSIEWMNKTMDVLCSHPFGSVLAITGLDYRLAKAKIANNND